LKNRLGPPIWSTTAKAYSDCSESGPRIRANSGSKSWKWSAAMKPVSTKIGANGPGASLM
jgi:hypothetical protein